MNLSIVIVNYRTFELTRDTINSVLEYAYPFNYEIIVVDNASGDDSLIKLQDYFKDKVKFIESKENKGFAAGNNLALRQIKSDYVLLLNSDTVVWENTLESVYSYMEEHSDVGACGCRVRLESGELDKACKRTFPNVKNSFFRLFHIPNKSQVKRLDANACLHADADRHLTGPQDEQKSHAMPERAWRFAQKKTGRHSAVRSPYNLYNLLSIVPVLRQT